MGAFVRGRPVIGSTGGGIPDLMKPGNNGILVDPDDAEDCNCPIPILTDQEAARRLAQGASQDGRHFRLWTPDRYADAHRAMVDRMLKPS